MSEGTEHGIDIKGGGKCPCGGTFQAGYETESGDPALLHSMPPCDDFVKKEPDVYLKWIRERGKN